MVILLAGTALSAAALADAPTPPVQTIEKYKSRFPNITDPQRQTYAGMLSAMDDAIGMVLAKLDAIGQRDNTLVVFHNDNGGPTTRNAVNGSRQL